MRMNCLKKLGAIGKRLAVGVYLAGFCALLINIAIPSLHNQLHRHSRHAFCHHVSYSQTGHASHRDTRPLDDTSHCHLCQLLSNFHTQVPAIVMFQNEGALVLTFLSFQESVKHSPPISLWYDRGPPLIA